MIIQGRYQIQEELGIGGMGKVFLGLDTQTNQPVAIKQLKPELLTEDMLERFRREGQALRDLNHPNIVKMLDSLEDNGNHYLIMEYVAGGDLKDLIEQGELPIQQVLQIAIDLADALTRAHRLDIIHRDLKPANVVIADDGTPRLTDFGVAYIADKERVTGTNAIIGTIDYLAPEILSDGEVTINTKADIWAFGVLLFEMLTGTRPFGGDSLAQTIYGIVSGEVPDLEDLRPDIPIALADLVYRMLEKDPNQRVPSVRHIGASLEDILQGRSTQTPPETRFETPPPTRVFWTKHNLPAQTSAFVGRESELGELIGLFNHPDVRLVTILAPGGMGKTRLSLELARRYAEDNLKVGATQTSFENGIYFIELAPLDDPEMILSAIVGAIGFQYQADERSHKQQLLDFLQPQKTLFVFDNFEHVIDGAGIVGDILRTAPHIRILATSRRQLAQTDETLFHLSGMEFPKWETPKDAMDYAAVKMFMNSAKRAKPDFELTKDNLPYVARICRLVQGMPLGILLAASWLGMLSLEEIAAEIQEGIDFLESETGEYPSRQQSIRTVMSYSWQMMNKAEQNVFMKLAVFKGGFTREAAQAVAGANLRILMSLVNKSLLRRDIESGRYGIHELLRQYAEEQLETSKIKDGVLYDYAKYFAEFMKGHWNHISFRSPESLKALLAEKENLRHTWQEVIDRADIEMYRLFMFCYAEFVRSLPNVQENITFLEKNILDLEKHDDTNAQLIMADACLSLAIISLSIDNQAAQKYVEKATPIYEAYPLSDEYILNKIMIAFLSILNKQYQKALEELEEIYSLSRETNYKVGEFYYHLLRQEIYMKLQDYKNALKEANIALSICEQANWSTVFNLYLLGMKGWIHAEFGDYDSAIEITKKAIAESIRWEHLYNISRHLGSLAAFYSMVDKMEDAQAMLMETIIWHQRLGRDWQMLGSIYSSSVGAVRYNMLDAETAIEYISMVYHHPESIPIYREDIDRKLPELKEKLDEAIFDAAWKRGKSRKLHDVVDEILEYYGQEAQ